MAGSFIFATNFPKMIAIHKIANTHNISIILSSSPTFYDEIFLLNANIIQFFNPFFIAYKAQFVYRPALNYFDHRLNDNEHFLSFFDKYRLKKV